MVAQYCPLADIGIFEVTGADARSFLHGQLSVNVNALTEQAAPLAAWSAANGRVRALVRIVVTESGYVLLAPASMAETISSKLALFVLRADVTIAPSTTRALGAVLEPTADWLAARAAALPAGRDRVARTGETHWIRAGPSLIYALAAPAALGALAAQAAPAERSAVDLAEIELGLPRIVPATAERFLPQMLDLDRLGGVAFDKGCFPGQEVIARTQHLGTVKRRPRRFALTGPPPEAGAPIYTADGTEVGQVLYAAAAADSSELLAVVRTDAAAPLCACRPDGPRLAERPIERP